MFLMLSHLYGLVQAHMKQYAIQPLSLLPASAQNNILRNGTSAHQCLNLNKQKPFLKVIDKV